MSLFGGITLPGHPDPTNIQRLDLLPLGQIRRMERMGMRIDIDCLKELSIRLDSTMIQLRKDIAEYVPPDQLEKFVGTSGELGDINPESSEQIAELLYEGLKLGDGVRIKRTKSGRRLTTGKKTLEQLKRQHPIVPLILEYREASKLRGTYADKLPRIAVWHEKGKECSVCGRRHWEGHWRVHTRILTTRTDTGRLASKPNLQNIPARTKLGAEIRKAFVPQVGCKLVGVDYAQIELRLLAHCANEPNMIRIFLEGGDIHLDTAMRAFNITDPAKVDKMLHRAPCKNVNFGVVYGLGDLGLLDLMALTYATANKELPTWLDVEWCGQFIQTWFRLYPQAERYLSEQHQRARRYGIVWTPPGRVRLVPEVRSVHERVVAAGLRQAGNMPIQGFAADVMKIGMGRVERMWEEVRGNGVDVEALLTIHDELISEVEEDWAESVLEWKQNEMGKALVDEKSGVEQCLVPILADGKVMDRWEK